MDEIVPADGEAHAYIADTGGKPGRDAGGAGSRRGPDLHLPGIAGIGRLHGDEVADRLEIVGEAVEADHVHVAEPAGHVGSAQVRQTAR